MKLFLLIFLMLLLGALTTHNYEKKYNHGKKRKVLDFVFFTLIINLLILCSVILKRGSVNLSSYKFIPKIFFAKYTVIGLLLAFLVPAFCNCLSKTKNIKDIDITNTCNDTRKIVSLSLKNIIIAGYIYITIPIIIFLLTWIRTYISIPAVLLFVSAFIYLVLKLEKDENRKISISIDTLIICCALLMLWVAYSGLGGYFFQTGDNHCRNAILRDLIDYSWPVIYPQSENALVYYLMFWMVPALFGKIGGWSVANFVLYLWGCIGIIIIFFHLLFLCNPKKNQHFYLITILFMGWSGLNLVGLVISNLFKICVHPIAWGSAEGWLDFSRNGYDCSYLYRSNIDALCQVYNQTVVPWLVTVTAISRPKTERFALIGLCALPYGPIPFIGLLPIFFLLAYEELYPFIKTRQFSKISKSVFSIPNIIGTIILTPIFWFYFSSNTAFSSSNEHFIALFVPWKAFDIPRVLTLLLFYFLEFGVYYCLIYKKYKKSILFWGVAIALILIPLFKIGTIRDFCMNASLPGLLLLIIWTMKYLIDEYRDTLTFHEACRYVLLVSVVVLSFTTIINDSMGKFEFMSNNKIFPYVADDIKSLSEKSVKGYENFLISDPDNIFFYKNIGRIKTEKEIRSDIVGIGNRLNLGKYYISPKVNTDKYLQSINKSILKNYNGKDLIVAENKIYLTVTSNKQLSDIFKSSFSKNKLKKYTITFPGDTNLDVPWGKVDEAGSVSSYAPNYQSPQQFQIVAAGDYFKILYGEYALTFNVDDNTVHLSKDNNLDSQMWKFEKKNTYKIINIDEKSKLRNVTNIDKYLNEIRDARYTVFIAVRDEAAVNLSETTDRLLHELGLKLSLLNKVQHAYLAVIDRSELVSEIISERREDAIIDAGQLRNGLFYDIESAGLPAGNYCRILINDNEFAVNWRGLNFVVYDNEIGKVIDSVAFDTWAEGNPAYR